MIDNKNIFTTENLDEITVYQPVSINKDKTKFVKPTDKLILAIDFDGTIVTDDFPNINEFMPGALESLKELQSYGVKLVLWTCRNDKFLTDAVEFLSKNRIVCEKYNENSSLLKFETSNKIYGDYYLDDRSFPGFPGWNTFMNEFRKAYNIKNE